MKIWEGLAKLDETAERIKYSRYEQPRYTVQELVKQGVIDLGHNIPAGSGKSASKTPDYDTLLDMLKEVKI